MLLTLASIFLFFLLNLLLGSVHIPLRSVWNILWGNTDESVIWQNIIWKSRVPQALTALVAGLRYWASVQVPAWVWLVWYYCPGRWAVWH